MVHKVLLFTGFGLSYIPPRSAYLEDLFHISLTDHMNLGLAVRAWQLGLEMRPILAKDTLWAYPIFAGVGASFGYWLVGVEERQIGFLDAQKKGLLEKRQRRAEREARKEGA
jgi:hypothetical protein